MKHGMLPSNTTPLTRVRRDKHKNMLLAISALVFTSLCASAWMLHDVLVPENSSFRFRWVALRHQHDVSSAWRSSAETGDFRQFIQQKVQSMNADQAFVQRMVRHAWQGYRQFGEWKDQVDPVNKTGTIMYDHNMAMTLVDSLDTLFLVGLFEEFEEASAFANDHWQQQMLLQPGSVSFFEVTIRCLGGFLSAYYLSGTSCCFPLNTMVVNLVFVGQQHLLDLAEALGGRLLSAFACGTSAPCRYVDLMMRQAHTDPFLAEATSFQLEFSFLAWATGDLKYMEPVDAMNEQMLEMVEYAHPSGLIPTQLDWHIGRGIPFDISFGGLGDSYYEYLLKQWLLSNKRNTRLRDQYINAIDSMRTTLLGNASSSSLVYLGALNVNGELIPKMEHLTCFVPGMLALGYYHGMPHWHLELAEELMQTCVHMYDAMPSALAPEAVWFLDERTRQQLNQTCQVVHDASFCVFASENINRLRPEAIESLFLLYRVTRNTTYQDHGRRIMHAIEAHSQVPTGGYRTTSPSHGVAPIMESFFLAETLKYLFLLFSEAIDLLPLSEVVFSTEAHVLPTYSTWYARLRGQKLREFI